MSTSNVDTIDPVWQRSGKHATKWTELAPEGKIPAPTGKHRRDQLLTPPVEDDLLLPDATVWREP